MYGLEFVYGRVVLLLGDYGPNHLGFRVLGRYITVITVPITKGNQIIYEYPYSDS